MGISPTQLIIILIIVALLFGTKRLRSIGSDLGSAIKGFKKSMSDEEKEKQEAEQQEKDRLPGKTNDVIEGTAKKVEPEHKDKV